MSDIVGFSRNDDAHNLDDDHFVRGPNASSTDLTRVPDGLAQALAARTSGVASISFRTSSDGATAEKNRNAHVSHVPPSSAVSCAIVHAQQLRALINRTPDLDGTLATLASQHAGGRSLASAIKFATGQDVSAVQVSELYRERVSDDELLDASAIARLSRVIYPDTVSLMTTAAMSEGNTCRRRRRTAAVVASA